MIDEKQFVIDVFGKYFKDFKESKIAIYGIGKNTQYILEHFNEYNFIGLMDEAKAGETIYGKKVLTKEQVLELGVDIIVIVAWTSNIHIIFRRISEFCATHSIQVYDLNGNNLMAKNSEIKTFDKYNDIDMKTLKDKISNADVVSFDVFDTLVMRRTLYPKDIFLIAEDKIKMDIFAKTRIKAEAELYQKGNPNIHEIYDKIQQILEISDETKERWKNTEISTEKEYLIQRKKICEAFEYAKSIGKEVFLVSDMYLPKNILCELLIGLEINMDLDHILVSCDYGFSKSNGLFNILKDKTLGKKVLHIGDNYDADERFAKAYGIDSVFHIESAIVMLADSYACDLLKYESDFCNRIIIGELIAKQLNDPFLFSETQGKFRVESNYDMAYSFLAPIVYAFFCWIAVKAKELDLECVLFASRDGYILEEISKLKRSVIPDFPETKYFYASRAAVVLAGLNSDEDILQAAGFVYVGSMEEMLKNRFRLEDNEIEERGECSDSEYVLKHRDAIMRKSRIARKNYLEYVKKLSIKRGSKVGFVDFVSVGTSQKGLLNFVDFNLCGLYFFQLYNKDNAALNIESLYGVKRPLTKSYHIFENLFFMESVLTSYEPTLQNFDEAGNPVFMRESRTEKQMDALKEVHCAILDYAKNMNTDIHKLKNADKELLDLIFYLLCEKYSVLTVDYFKLRNQVDEFVNRKFELSGIG